MEALIYLGVLILGYLIWIKIKAFFTGRSFSDQVSHDDTGKKERVCRNCYHCMGTRCNFYGENVDANNTVCDCFKKR